jgi:hypothetical protein
MKNLPANYRLTQHSISRRWRIERKEGGQPWKHVQDVLCEGGWGGRTFIFRWMAKWAMCNMIAKELEKWGYDNGKWEPEEL